MCWFFLFVPFAFKLWYHPSGNALLSLYPGLSPLPMLLPSLPQSFQLTSVRRAPTPNTCQLPQPAKRPKMYWRGFGFKCQNCSYVLHKSAYSTILNLLSPPDHQDSTMLNQVSQINTITASQWQNPVSKLLTQLPTLTVGIGQLSAQEKYCNQS